MVGRGGKWYPALPGLGEPSGSAWFLIGINFIIALKSLLNTCFSQ